jgi:NAD(P)-dependent dehydrogenase (short-subunit alcohol dehydrogenase family)
MLTGRVVVVTGGGRGLGRAYGLALATAGARVIVNDVGCDVGGDGVDASVAKRVVEEIRAAGGEAVANTVPVGTESAAEGIVAAALAAYGRLDAIVNNAGITRSHPFAEFPLADWERIVAVHLTGTFTCARAAFRVMAAAGRGGRIINTTSGAGLDAAYPGTAAYAAAKGGVVSLTRVVAAEGKPHGITCNAIAPLARTRMSGTFLSAEVDDPTLDAATVAPLVVYLASEASAAVSGEIFRCRHGQIATSHVATGAPAITDATPWTVEQIAARIGEIVGRDR